MSSMYCNLQFIFTANMTQKYVTYMLFFQAVALLLLRKYSAIWF